MKCRQHSTDLSSAVGVCATCLRERLFLLVSAQSQHIESHSDHRLKSDPPLFPRSVSPYVSRREFSDTAESQHVSDFSNRRSRSTPQVGPSSSGFQTTIIETSKKRRSRFSFITRLFKSRSYKSESDPRTASNWSPLWCPPGSISKSVPKIVGKRVQNRVSDRGMSPSRSSFDDVEVSSSRSSDSCAPTWKQTPVSAPVAAPSRRRHSNMSEFRFCLSPLVRASPNRNWNRSNLAAEGVEVVGASRKAQLTAANAFCKNRSKKMADFGRGGHDYHRR